MLVRIVLCLMDSTIFANFQVGVHWVCSLQFFVNCIIIFLAAAVKLNKQKADIVINWVIEVYVSKLIDITIDGWVTPC
jgi:hypothetical protein